VIPLTDRTAEPCYFVFGTLEEREWHMPLNLARRKLLAALGGVAAWPLAARAQQPAKVPMLGYLTGDSDSADSPRRNAFREGIHKLGYNEGQTTSTEPQREA
jgi:hypothetical protein